MVSLLKEFENGKKLNFKYFLIFYNYDEKDYIVIYTKNKDNLYEEINNIYKTENGYYLYSIYNYELDNAFKDHAYINNNTKYELALNYASNKHKNQFRKGKEIIPYIIHPINVARLVSQYIENVEAQEVFIPAALLHDTIEDSDASYDEIKSIFGQRIADVVLELTNDKDEIKNDKKSYLSKKMEKMEDNVLILKLCDRLDNISSLENADSEFINKYTNETVFIINHLLLCRKLNEKQLAIINEIMNKIHTLTKNKSMKLIYE